MKASRVLICMLLLDGLLILSYLAGFAIRGEPFVIFNLDGEANLAAWWSNAKFVSAGACFGLLAFSSGRRWVTPWVFFVLLMALGADEIAGVHERIGHVLADKVLAEASFRRIDAFAWPLLFGLPFVIAGSWVFWRLSRERFLSPRLWRNLGIALAVFFAGAIGVELVSFNPWVPIAPESWSYHLLVVLEEGMEHLGTSLLVWVSIQSLVEHRQGLLTIDG